MDITPQEYQQYVKQKAKKSPLVKDTALARIISVVELFDVAAKAANSYVSTVPFVVAAVFYLVMNLVVGQLFLYAERRMNYYR